MDRHLPSLDEDGVAQIRRAIYESVGELDAWPEALRQAGRAMGATGVVAALPTFDAVAGYAFDAIGVDVDFQVAAAYSRESGSLDPWTVGALPKFPQVPGLMLLGREMCPRDEIRASHWFEPVLKPIGLGEVLTATFAAPAGSPATIGLCVMHRPFDWEPYDEDGARRFALFAPEIGRASRVGFALRASRPHVLAAAFDRLAQALFVLGRGGVVLHANAVGERLLERADVVALEGKRLSSRTEPARGRIARAVAEAVNVGKGSDVPVARPGRLGCMLTFTPLPTHLGDVDGALVLVVVDDPEATAAADTRTIQSLFGLTDAEASVASEVAAGVNLADIAIARKVSRETVRVQLKAVFSKTGVRRQAELAALFATLARRRGENAAKAGRATPIGE